jgi:hypothetical protein
MNDLATVMQGLYASEINCGIQSMYDKSFDVWLGDEMNGMKATQNFTASQLPSAGEWLHEMAINH